MRTCSCCILSNKIPGISFDREGVCNFCRSFEKAKKSRMRQLDSIASEEEMLRLLKTGQKKPAYDCVCLYSGGKDSTFMLYQLVKKYKLRVLAFTLDNHFLAAETHANIKKTLSLIDVDHIFYRPDFDLIKELFKASINESHRLKSTKELSFIIGFVCWPCFTMIGQYALKIALERHIPNIIIGTTPGQLRQKKYNLLAKYKGIFDTYRSMNLPMLKLLKFIGYKKGQSLFKFSLKEKFMALRARLVPFYEYVPYQEEEALKIIEKELRWQKPKNTDSCSTNCELNSLGIALHIQRYGIHPYVIPLAHDVREGILDREDALRAVRELPRYDVALRIAKELGIELTKKISKRTK